MKTTKTFSVIFSVLSCLLLAMSASVSAQGQSSTPETRMVGKITTMAEYLTMKRASAPCDLCGFFGSNKQSDLIEVIKSQCESGFPVEHRADLNGRDSRGRTVLFYAVRDNNAPLVRAILNSSCLSANPSISDNNNRSPLMVAITKLNVDILRDLLEDGADTETAKTGGNNIGYKAIDFASNARHYDIAYYLVKHGASVPRVANALRYALQNPAYMQLVGKLGTRKTTNFIYRGFLTPLHYAASMNDAGLAKALLEDGADCTLTIPGITYTPAVTAYREGHVALSDMIAKKGGRCERPACSDGEVISNKGCICSKEKVNNRCLPKCSDGKRPDRDNCACVSPLTVINGICTKPDCSAGTRLPSDSCECRSPLTSNNNICQSRVVLGCAEGERVGTNGCICRPPLSDKSGKCVRSCQPNEQITNQCKCRPPLSDKSGKCVRSCQPNEQITNQCKCRPPLSDKSGKCVRSCQPNEQITNQCKCRPPLSDKSGRCVRSCQQNEQITNQCKCRPPLSDKGGKCVRSCQQNEQITNQCKCRPPLSEKGGKCVRACQQNEQITNQCKCRPPLINKSDTCQPRDCAVGEIVGTNGCVCRDPLTNDNSTCRPICKNGEKISTNKCICQAPMVDENGDCRPPPCMKGERIGTNGCVCRSPLVDDDGVCRLPACKHNQLVDANVCECRDNYTILANNRCWNSTGYPLICLKGQRIDSPCICRAPLVAESGICKLPPCELGHLINNNDTCECRSPYTNFQGICGFAHPNETSCRLMGCTPNFDIQGKYNQIRTYQSCRCWTRSSNNNNNRNPDAGSGGWGPGGRAGNDPGYR